MRKRIIQRQPDRKIRIHSWTWLTAALLLLALQVSFPSRAWMTLLIILGGAWLIGFLWVLLLGRSLSLRREMRYGWAQVGDLIQERYTLYNESFLPAPLLEVRDHSSIPGYLTGRVTSMDGNQVISWRTEGACTRRGLYTLGPTTTRASDPLGLCSVELLQPDSSVLLVLPPVLPLPGIEIAPGGLTREGRLHRRTALETTISAETVRQYTPGDPLRSIHWRTSARREDLFVRQFEHLPSADWWIFLDLDRHVQTGGGAQSTEEHGIILAASLASQGIHNGIQVGLVMHGESLTWLPPQRSASQLMDIMRSLALVHAGECPLEDLLAEARHSIHHGASLIIITPSVNTRWLAPLLRLVENGVVPTVLLFDPHCFGSLASIDPIVGFLSRRGIAHTIIPPELFNKPEAQPGRQGKWEWEVVAPGKVVQVRRPVNTDWRPLA